MQYAWRRPAGPLAGFVEQIWFFEGYAQPHPRERLLPDGTMELILNLSEDEVRVWDPTGRVCCERLEGAALVGPHSRYFVIDTAEQRSVMGVHFRPGGAFPFLGIPAGELHGLHVSLSQVWGGFAREVRERILGLRGVQARFDLMEAALLRRVQRPLALDGAVRFAAAEFARSRRTVGDVCEETGLSARRFIELFRTQIGMTPKQYSRVRRFQRIVRTAPEDGSSIDWCDAALGAGYSDQSHLIHEFQAIAGMTPAVWAGLKTAHRNHVPMGV